VRESGADWQTKALTLAIPAIVAMGGWAFSMEGRLQRTVAQQEERGPRIAHFEVMLEDLAKEIHDPVASPETRISLDSLRHDFESLDDRVTRLEERVNNLHSYILALPIRPGPYAPSGATRR
jgi:hypothetical protein